MQAAIKNFGFTYWRHALAVVAVLAIGWYFFGPRSANLGETLTVAPGDFVQQVSVSGAVTAAKNVDLGFAANGRIEGVYAKVGQLVTAGTAIAAIENGDLIAALEQKRASLTQAEANLASLRSGTRPEEVAIASAAVVSAQSSLIDAIQSAYTAADDSIHNKTDSLFTNPRTSPKINFSISNIALKNAVENDRLRVETSLASWAALVGTLSGSAAADAARQSQLYLSQVTTLLADANAALNYGIPDSTTSAATLASYVTTLATARTTVNGVATALTTAAAALDSAENTLALKLAGSTSDTIAAQEAAVASAQAEVENAQAALAKTYVTAPFTGVVTRMDAKVGEIVSPTTSLISMQSNGIFQIETYVPEVSIAGISIGNSATTTLDAYGSSVEFPATVVAVDPAETMKDGVPAYKTTLSFLSADPRIRSGMTANVIITIGTLHNAIVIPRGSIGSKDGMPYVSVLSGGKTVNRPVVTGVSPALGQTEVISGLSDGDVILLKPAL